MLNTLPSHLLEPYLSTNYNVFFKNKIITLNVGIVSLAMDALLKELDAISYSFQTAWNPYSELKSIEINTNKNLELEKNLQLENYRYLFGKGESVDGDWFEDSLCILNIQKEKAIELGNKFNQYAILYGEVNKPPQLFSCVK
jgi:hypothetical protein